ncbi:MAG: SPOR domain-containing protein, partial [Balneolaceae bacterium]
RYRSSMADVYASLDHDIPERFLQTYEGRTVERDPFEGFRIQIYSDREVASADSIAGEFRVWADTTLSSQYEPDTYVFFKPPYYKVHVGDFHNRDQANEFAQIVKELHPDAWVVHDRVNPSEVPADSAEFKLRDPDEEDNDNDEDEDEE